jgi:parvulin-like peptidyl-prolyl isomerase
VLSLVTLALLVFAADAPGVLQTEAPLAALGKRVLREADFQRYLQQVYSPEQAEEINRNSSDRQNAIEEYLDSVAIAAKARRAGIDQETRFKKALELMEVKTLSHLVTERYRDRILRSSQVSPEEVKTYYEQHKHEFTEEPRFTAHHLLVYVRGNPAFPEKGLGDAEARAKAKAALAQLRAGKSWDAVAKTYSDDVGTSQKEGLIRDGQFGYFAPEVERAVRMQELGKPGEVVKTVFGYHVLQVEDRITEKVPRPFEQVKEMLTDRLSQQRSREARKAFMTPIWEEVGFKLREAGTRDGFLLDENAVAPEEVLAEVGGKNVLESDFRWFLKDALIPQQRMSAYSRPGARQGMLSSFLDMLVLEAKARKDGLDKTPDFVNRRVVMEEKLLSEFMQARDKAGLFCQCGNTDEERRSAQRDYFERVRAEVGLKLAASRSR